MDKTLNYIIESVKIYAKNYVRNNPHWDHETLLQRIEDKALMEAQFENYNLSEEELSYIKKISARDLEGEMKDAKYFEDNR